MPNNQSNTIAKKIIRFRQNKGLSQVACAKILNISRNTLGAYENGKEVTTSFIRTMRTGFPDDNLSWLTDPDQPLLSIVEEPRAEYTKGSLEDRISRMEHKIEVLIQENKKMIEKLGNIAQYIIKK